MKKLLLLSLLISIGFNKSYAEDSICEENLVSHLKLIQSTDEYFQEVNNHDTAVSSFEIIEIQKRLTSRFLSLKNLFNVYNSEDFNCSYKILPEALAVYDFARVGETLFKSKSLRRVVKGFVKFEDYQLRDYLSYYKKFTKRNFKQTVQNKIKSYSEINEDYKKLIAEVNKSIRVNVISDFGTKATTSVVAASARILGFISDHTSWREGYLKDNLEALDILKSNLKPFDIIYEKRKFFLTNYTIPGHWGHLGVWLGTKQELIEMGVWDQEYFAPFKEYVEAGKNIMEARKEGISYQALETFINLDEVAVTRVKNISDNSKEIFTELAKQVKKKYDFKFDARSADKITCAELVSFSYGDLVWPETKTLFQTSISPDDMASATLESNPNSEFILYLKGSKNHNSFENLGFEDWSQLFKRKK